MLGICNAFGFPKQIKSKLSTVNPAYFSIHRKSKTFPVYLVSHKVTD